MLYLIANKILKVSFKNILINVNCIRMEKGIFLLLRLSVSPAKKFALWSGAELKHWSNLDSLFCEFLNACQANAG